MIVAFLSSCSESPKTLDAIPKEAQLVAVVDGYALTQKGELDKLNELKSVQAASKEIKNESKSASKLVEKVLEDPKTTGIDLRKEVLIYLTSNEPSNQFVGITAELFDDGKFKTFIEEALNETKTSDSILQKGPYNIITNGRDYTLTWDGDKLLFLVAQSYKSRNTLLEKADEFMKLSPGDNISANSSFKKFFENKKDLSLWLTGGLLANGREFAHLRKQLGDNFADNSASFFLNFEKGAIRAQVSVDLTSETKKRFEKFNIGGGKFDRKLLAYFPETTYGLISTSMNTEAYYDNMMEQPEIKNVEPMVSVATGVPLKDIITNFKGNMVLSLSGMEENGSDFTPYMGLAMDYEKKEIIEKLLEKVPGGMLQQTDGYYSLPIPGKFPVYMALGDKALLVTTDPASRDAFTGTKKLKRTLAENSARADKIENNNTYLYLNLNTAEYPENFRTQTMGRLNSKEQKAMDIWNGLMENIEITNSNVTSSEVVFHMKGDENSLREIIKALDENYLLFASM
ncbi:hypothetical protein FUAX_12650 [Fulvitalea axinellae]|uniref:DUF4836 family protein n=2 Tax=Fulvitalea axinellae TaxID=1182444 RepID=A0AAU9CFS4_9BACT|nr:hypothetical protein FUAX_12650 [Fulvitalea axinellae]